MRVHPHENLALCEIRHHLYGSGRFHHPHRHGNDHLLHVHHTRPTDSPLRPTPTRIVEKSHRPRPADCRPCQQHRDTHDIARRPSILVDPRHTPARIKLFILPDPQALSTPISIESQGFLYGQMVPAAGGLLDVFA